MILLLSFVALLFKINAVLIVLSALDAGGLFIRPAANGEIPKSGTAPAEEVDRPRDRATLRPISARR